MKRKIKIAKNVAKVPERRAKMRRKKREKRSSGRWFCRREIFIFGWGVCVVHVAVRFWERFWEDSKASNGFTKKVSDGAKVHAGDVLIEADLNAIKEAGHPATTMMILTNTDLYDSVECAAPGTVTGKSSVMKLMK